MANTLLSALLQIQILWYLGLTVGACHTKRKYVIIMLGQEGVYRKVCVAAKRIWV